MENQSQDREEKSVLAEISHFFNHIFDLREGLDRWGTIESIDKNILLKGSNVWLLISGLFIASIGLDTSSVAVIIGAMLISPLMSPILGIGLGVGINDRKMILRSLFNFTVAVVISLIVSTIYFILTPLGDATTEILSRTRPTILDVGVAFFGGMAGIVAASRKEKMNAVPGVAIATALLPPLCVTGFGIANRDLSIVWGSFYLFFLNSVFVSLATFLVVRVLKFPFREFLNRNQKIKSNLLVTAFVILVCIPAGTVLIEVINELGEKRSIETFIQNNVDTETHQAIKWMTLGENENKELKLYVVGEYMDSLRIVALSQKLNDAGLNQYKLRLTQFEKEPADFNKMSEEIKRNVLSSVDANQQLMAEKDSRIQQITAERDSLKQDTVQFEILKEEIKAMYPELKRMACSTLQGDSTNAGFSYIFYMEWDTKLKNDKRIDFEKRIQALINERLKISNFKQIAWPE